VDVRDGNSSIEETKMRTLGTVLAVALLSGASVAGAQQLQLACDTNNDGSVDAKESSLCMEQRFDEIAKEEVLTEEVLSTNASGEKGPVFAEVDENGDGKVSREEWTSWNDKGFTAATEASQGMMPTADYESMIQEQGYVRPLTPNKQ
jgi:Ca2+-binding EF-hand superfamily protein